MTAEVGRRGICSGGDLWKNKEDNSMNANIYATVTDRILKCLDAGVIPWRKTWRTGLPKNLMTGREYRGINILVLSLAGYGSRYWLTYRQAFGMGGHVRKGEKATPVVYWKWHTAGDLKRLAEKAGKAAPPPCYPFVNAVFNLDQIDGVAQPADDVPAESADCVESAEQLVSCMPDRPEIIHGASLEPAYCPSLDQVMIPNICQFENAGEYYGALFHELGHSTGHPKRLNRRAEAEGDRQQKYSFEELVAEFTAAFLCAHLGIDTPDHEARQADYIQGWAEVFRRDSRILLRAASAAQKAADFIRGTTPAHDSAGADGQPAPMEALPASSQDLAIQA